MCVAVNKYENIIYWLENDIYPEFQQLLNGINTCLFPQKIKRLVLSVQKDFESLDMVDRVLVFPAVLSLFNEDRKDNEFTPDVKAIINITNIKEEKLKKSVDQISEVFENKEVVIEYENEQEAALKKLQVLIRFFYQRFLPAKKLWQNSLSRLQSDEGTQCNNRA